VIDDNSQNAVDADFFAAHCPETLGSKQLDADTIFDDNFRPDLAFTFEDFLIVIFAIFVQTAAE